VSWVSPAAKVAMSLTVRHGPKVKAAWSVAGKPLTEAAMAKAKDLQMRSQAVKDAATRADGSVLPMSRGGKWLWVVYSGDVPKAIYPPTTTPLAEVVESARLTDRFTPEQFYEAQLRVRATRAGLAAGRAGARTAAQVGRKAGQAGTSLAHIPVRRKGSRDA
jgi:hypothetical protein